MGRNSVSLDLVTAMQFRARTGSGHEITVDSTADVGGENAGARPMELVLVSLAGCAAMDVISILRKMREDVTAYHIEATGDTSGEHPRVYTSIELVHAIRGRSMREANVRRAIHLSMSRYCPVFAMLAPAVPVRARYTLEDETGGGIAEGEVTPDEPAPDRPTGPSGVSYIT
jgi:putative redox protein